MSTRGYKFHPQKTLKSMYFITFPDVMFSFKHNVKELEVKELFKTNIIDVQVTNPKN